MTYKQLVQPNININAKAGWCLNYVDNAINATQRTNTAQIAHDQAKEKNWVHSDTNYPKNVWFVMFWSIDNGDYQGLGHVALAFLDDAGSLQIHDSEVHRNARQPYNSLTELASWFGSVGTQLTFLGWGEGVDGTKIIEEVKQAQEQTQTNTKKKGEVMILFKDEDGKIYWLIGNRYTYVGSPDELEKIYWLMNQAGYDTHVHTNTEQIKYLKLLATLV